MLRFRWPESSAGCPAARGGPGAMAGPSGVWGTRGLATTEARNDRWVLQPEPPPPPFAKGELGVLPASPRVSMRVATLVLRSSTSAHIRARSCCTGVASRSSLCVSALELSTRAASGRISQAAWRTAASAASMRSASRAQRSSCCFMQRSSNASRREPSEGPGESEPARPLTLRCLTSDSTLRMVSALRLHSSPSAWTIAASLDTSCRTSAVAGA
mmetsp:Transcript_41372/g.122814  ORF Transcript_41372/g.122814 Transcript_41372/m.122814 type:complete len:215 (+) Transcript_41372:211-855(+)